MSAMNISDVSAISVLPNAVVPPQQDQSLGLAAGFVCDVCGLSCKSSAGLQNHKVRGQFTDPLDSYLLGQLSPKRVVSLDNCPNTCLRKQPS